MCSMVLEHAKTSTTGNLKLVSIADEMRNITAYRWWGAFETTDGGACMP